MAQVTSANVGNPNAPTHAEAAAKLVAEAAAVEIDTAPEQDIAAPVSRIRRRQ